MALLPFLQRYEILRRCSWNAAQQSAHITYIQNSDRFVYLFNNVHVRINI